MNMKASCEFVLLSVLFAFSWGKEIQKKTRLQPGIPEQSVRIESIDVPPAEPPALQVKMVIEPGGVLPTMTYTEKLRPEGVLFSAFWYTKV